ncbi:MAG: DUF2853 family protein [Patescibacteria group bacterium]
MATKKEAMELYSNELTSKLGIKEINIELLDKIVTGLGIAAYQTSKDSALVSGKDKTEKQLVADKLLIGKFGMEKSDELLDIIDSAIETYGSKNPRKYRAVLYYLITTELKMEAKFLA